DSLYSLYTGFETTSKFRERSKRRIWENSPVDCSIVGEENPVISTNKEKLTFRLDSLYSLYTGFETTSKFRERSKRRIWENSPVDCSIVGEENPVALI
ncbi:MAG: hypothetical protein IJZ75_06290, partial [Clostridia bacterium]|nr:hypothetical protein [Clostridia bacterium]